jgi:hypothetical protein
LGVTKSRIFFHVCDDQ